MRENKLERPGQLKPNDFENSILQHIALESSSVAPLISKLHVLSREFTGVGSYTNFNCTDSATDLGDQSISLNKLINMPNVPNGMGAILFCENGKPKCLETYTFGSEHWDGIFHGFSIDENT